MFPKATNVLTERIAGGTSQELPQVAATRLVKNCFGSFKLSHDWYCGADAVQMLLHVLNVLRGADKGYSQPVNLIFHAAFNCAFVRVCERRAVYPDARDVDAFVRGDQSSDFDDGLHRRVHLFGDFQADRPIRYVYFVACGEALNYIGLRKWKDISFCRLRLRRKRNPVTRVDTEGPLNLTQAQLGSAKVLEYGDMFVVLLFNASERLNSLRMLFQGAVREIQPGNIHASEEKLFQRFGVRGSGTDCCDYLCFSHEAIPLNDLTTSLLL